MTAPADPPASAGDADAKKGSLGALKAVNFLIADVQNGMGLYIALFLQSSVGWGPAQIGSALAAGNSTQVAQGIGAFLSNSVAGYLAKTRGDDSTFYVLAAIAVASLMFFWVLMPETQDQPGADPQPA